MPNRLQIGTLIFGGEAVVPPENGVLYRPSKENSAPKIVDTQTGKAITWIVVGGKLMADRCLLRDISYFTIDTEFLAGPCKISLDGLGAVIKQMRTTILATGPCVDMTLPGLGQSMSRTIAMVVVGARFWSQFQWNPTRGSLDRKCPFGMDSRSSVACWTRTRHMISVWCVQGKFSRMMASASTGMSICPI